MRLLREIDSYSSDTGVPLVLALGNFDGLHLGHQELLEACRRKAGQIGGVSAVFTFQEHPQQILNPSVPVSLLSSREQKLFLIQQSGIDICFMISFTRKFSLIEAEDFVKKIFVQQLKVHTVFTGHEARFGRNRLGNTALMRKLAGECGFSFIEFEGVREGKELISSSRIRRLLEAGDLQGAQACLGRNFNIFAKVIPGDGRGAKLGFPTANLDTSLLLLPPHGVYPVRVRVMNVPSELTEKTSIHPASDWYEGVLNHGLRPTFNASAKKASAEIFILDWNGGDLYGKTLEVVFYSKLREEMKFPSAEVLKDQIQKDVAFARTFFGRHSAAPI